MTARQPRWQRFAALLSLAEKSGLDSLHIPQVEELHRLHQLVCSDLNKAQTVTGNPALLDHLESLAARGHRLLTPAPKRSPINGLIRALWWHFPNTLRTQWRLLVLSTALMLGGGVFGFATTYYKPDLIRTYMPAMFATHLEQSPSERVAEAEKAEINGTRSVGSAGSHAVFSTHLMTHNIRVSVLMLGLGLTFGVGTGALLFYNGVILGTLACAYWKDGVTLFFVAWVGPHGAWELPAILIAGTGGLMLAKSQWIGFRKGGLVMAHVRKQTKPVASLVLGAAVMLVVAGFVEGGFSQVNEPTIPYPLKIAVAGLLFGLLVVYILFAGAGFKQRDADDGVEAASG